MSDKAAQEPIVMTLRTPWDEMGGMDISLDTPYSAICSIGKVPFTGTIRMSYNPFKLMLEFESYERWLRWYTASGPTTVEELCFHIHRKLWNALMPLWLNVVVDATTIVHGHATAALERRAR